MSKILIFAKALIHGTDRVLVSFFEQFVEYLRSLGNEIMFIEVTNILTAYYRSPNTIHKSIDKDLLLTLVQSFSPDVIFAFNNNIPRHIEKNTTCPIVAWMADSWYMFNDIERILKSQERYSVFVTSEGYIDKIIKAGISSHRVFCIPNATSIKSKNMQKKINISFIGTMFQISELTSHILKGNDLKSRRDISNVTKNGFANIDSPDADLINKKIKSMSKNAPIDEIFALNTPSKRLFTLNELAPLGLHLYGNEEWKSIRCLFPWLFASYVEDRVYSSSHMEMIYNSSLISLSIAHDQAFDGFPWRVLDIMATNSVILSDYRPYLKKITANHVDIPMYSSPYEAYQLAKELIDDQERRKDIILASQELINREHRWNHRTALIEEALNMKISASNTKEGESLFIFANELQKT